MNLEIQLPLRADQQEFNLRVWETVLADTSLAKIPSRIETDRHGHIIMSPPTGPSHGTRQFEIAHRLKLNLGGRSVTECAVSTSDGVKAADVGWFSDLRYARAFDDRCFTEAPEICVEVLSPSNTPAEMEEKKSLYFDAGAEEVWFCDVDGNMSFRGPQRPLDRSTICPEFPGLIEI